MRPERYDDMTEKMTQRFRASQIGGWSSILVNLVVFGFKLWVGLAGNSLLLITDAWHTLSDSITSVIVLISGWVSRKPADEEHPYGHGRAENIATLVIGVILGVVSIEFMREAVLRLLEGSEPSYSFSTGIVVLASVIIKRIMGMVSIHLGKKYNLSSLRADGQHHNSDALSSLAVLAGIIIGLFFRLWWVDGFLSGVVALYIGFTAYKIVSEATDSLMGRRTDKHLEEQIQQICEAINSQHEISLQPHHFHLHKYGEHQELTFHVFMPWDWSIGKGHEIIEDLENEISKKLEIEATVHIDPRLREA